MFEFLTITLAIFLGLSIYTVLMFVLFTSKKVQLWYTKKTLKSATEITNVLYNEIKD